MWRNAECQFMLAHIMMQANSFLFVGSWNHYITPIFLVHFLALRFFFSEYRMNPSTEPKGKEVRNIELSFIRIRISPKRTEVVKYLSEAILYILVNPYKKRQIFFMFTLSKDMDFTD